MVAVNEALLALPLDTCKKVCTTLQMVYNEIILIEGDNNYKLPHAGKDKVICQLQRDIPLKLPCQAMLEGGTIDGDVIVAFANSEANPTPVLIPPKPAMLIVDSPATTTINDNDVVEWDVADEENEIVEGDADDLEDDSDGVTAMRRRTRNILEGIDFWETFDDQIEWGGDDYEHHTDEPVRIVDSESGEDGDDGGNSGKKKYHFGRIDGICI